MAPKKWAIAYAVFGLADILTTIIAVQYLGIAREGNPLMAPLIGTPWFLIIKGTATIFTSVLVYVVLTMEKGWLRLIPKLAVLTQVAVVAMNGAVILVGGVL